MNTLMDKISQDDRLFKLIQLDENSMQIVQLIGESAEDSVTTINLSARSLLIAMRDALGQATEALQWKDPSRVMPAMKPIWQWWKDNFHTGKVSGGGYGLRSALIKYKQTSPNLPKKINDHIIHIVNSPEMPRDSEARVSIEEKIRKMVQVLGSILPTLSTNGSTLSSELQTVSNNLHNTVKELRRIKPKDAGIDSTPATPKAATGPSITSQQNQQVEAIINQTLASIPKDIAAKIRAVVARSDNKLGTLHQQMLAHSAHA